MTLYLVRHGETTYNAEGRIQGHSDAPLSSLGLRQAEAIACRLSRESFAAIFSSDLGRARATAEIIAADRELPVRTTPLLRESNLGVLQGLTRAEVDERYPREHYEWRRDNTPLRPPGAESWDDVVERCRRFLGELARERENAERVLVVGHGGSLRGLIIAALELPISAYTKLHFSNASLSILETGEKPGLWLLNDTCHLSAMRTDEEEVDRVAH